MKTGIMTFHFADNYGALLQSFALSEFLAKEGVENELINLELDYIKKNTIIPDIFTLKSIISTILKIVLYPHIWNRAKQFSKFRSNNLRLSEKIKKDNSDWTENYKILITGSDQTFNINYNFTNVFFQPWKKRQNQIKAAYAPSFGTTALDKTTETKIKNYLNDFNFLSCREEEGAQFISKIIGKDVPLVLDPVFLLTSKDWENSLSLKRPSNDKYIFIYDLNGGRELIELARKYSPTDKIIVLTNDILLKYKCSKYKNIKYVYDASIEKFLSYIKYAEEVITDSFHGTALSIIFNKNFNTYISLERASSRITSILQIAGLSNRIVSNGQFNSEIIDYKKVESNLSVHRISSIDYLKSIVGLK